MRCLKLTVSYRGTRFAGWQVQPGQPTIQESLEHAFQQITGQRIKVVGSGRTDAGVHALGQVASVVVDTDMECFRLLRGLNATTPEDISVVAVEEAPPGFHAIRDATRKRYRYRIQHGRIRDPLMREFCWFVPTILNVDAIRQAAQALIGEHDFICFQASGAERNSTIRTIFVSAVNPVRQGPFDFLEYEIEGNGFLYNMVRNIVGSLVEIGKGKKNPEWIPELIERRDRTLAGETAPPQGLFLVNVEYAGLDGDG